MRTIDADELLAIFRADEPDEFSFIPVYAIRKYIEQAPTISPVKRGHWYTDPMYGYVSCSVCGHEAITASFEIMRTRYCPNCGAKMEEPKNETN